MFTRGHLFFARASMLMPSWWNPTTTKSTSHIEQMVETLQRESVGLRAVASRDAVVAVTHSPTVSTTWTRKGYRGGLSPRSMAR